MLVWLQGMQNGGWIRANIYSNQLADKIDLALQGQAQWYCRNKNENCLQNEKYTGSWCNRMWLNFIETFFRYFLLLLNMLCPLALSGMKIVNFEGTG